MATPREIKNRIKSVKNTRKITSTMEMVSTSKMKRVLQRLDLSKPYEEKINEIIANLLLVGGDDLSDSLFNEVAEPTKALIFLITGNRGLCGSYNTNVIENSLDLKRKLESEGKDVSLYVIGKKATSFFNFSGMELFKAENNPEDKVTFENAATYSSELKELFLSGKFEEVYVSYTKVITNAVHKPETVRLLPIQIEEEKQEVTPVVGSAPDYIFEPNPFEIFQYLLPLYLKVRLFTCFLESSYSEQFARRVAMKNATDAAAEMVRELTISYNRARQAKITNEILEIVSGADALA